MHLYLPYTPLCVQAHHLQRHLVPVCTASVRPCGIAFGLSSRFL